MGEAFVNLYRYPHPFIPGRWLYVGQGAKRDAMHRAGTTSFGRRFKRLFPGVPLPQPIRWRVAASNHLEANEAETIAMFQYHTWRGYGGGMNLTLPGSKNYQNLGTLGSREDKARACRIRNALHGNPWTPEGSFKGGRKGGRKRIELYGNPRTPEGSLKGARNQPREAKIRGGQKGGRTQGRNNAESGRLHVALCKRWNINRGKQCVCGSH